MTEKTFTFRVSFGDGNPIDVAITAKTIVDALDAIKVKYPNARNTHLLESSSSQRKLNRVALEQYVLPLDDPEDPAKLHEDKVKTCVLMRKSGHSHQSIAGCLGIGKSTVGRWLKQHG